MLAPSAARSDGDSPSEGHGQPSPLPPPPSRSRALVSAVRDFNIFPKAVTSEDEAQLHHGRWSTRLYVCAVLVAIISASVYYSASSVSTVVVAQDPSYNSYQSWLHDPSLQDLRCSCRSLSVSVDAVSTSRVRFHDMCDWFDDLRAAYPNEWRGIDGWVFRPSVFGDLCSFSTRHVQVTLDAFRHMQIVNAFVPPPDELQAMLTAQLDVAMTQAIATLGSAFNIARNVFIANRPFNENSGSFQLNPAGDAVNFVPASGLWAINSSYGRRKVLPTAQSCLLSPRQIASGTGLACYYLEGLIDISLARLYINGLYDFSIDPEWTIPADFMERSRLNPNHTRFNVDASLEQLVLAGFVESYGIQSNHSLYYNQCQPSSCTFRQTSRLSASEVLLQLLALLGGVVSVLNFVVPTLVSIVIRVPSNKKEGTVTSTHSETIAHTTKDETTDAGIEMSEIAPQSASIHADQSTQL